MYAGDLTMGLTLTGGALTPGRWGHVAFSIDTTGTAKLFVDGAEVASGSFQGGLRYGNVQCSLPPLPVSINRSSSSTRVLAFSAFGSPLLLRSLQSRHVRCTGEPSPRAGPRMLLEDCDMALGESLDTDGSFNGHVYDFRLWSRALTAADVAPGLKVRTSLYV